MARRRELTTTRTRQSKIERGRGLPPRYPDHMPAPTDPLELRHRPIQTRGIVRFDAILNAGRGLLADEGLERFTMEDVATRAGVPNATGGCCVSGTPNPPRSSF